MTRTPNVDLRIQAEHYAMAFQHAAGMIDRRRHLNHDQLVDHLKKQAKLEMDLVARIDADPDFDVLSADY